MSAINDLTIVFYSANVIEPPFTDTLKVGVPIVSVTHKPMELGENIVVDLPRHHLSIYKQALIGAKAATTEYIALAEDDILYSPAHFKKRPSPGKFAYNVGCWGLYTWVTPPVFSFKGRRNLSQLICERELFIEAMEERFAKYPDGKVRLGHWAEPGKYEHHLGITTRETEEFYTNPFNVMFSHETALAYGNLGNRKKLGDVRATAIPGWGTAEEVAKLWPR